jgi:hypothetical protein
MDNIHKVTLEAINHIIQNDPIVAKSNQELALSRIGINSGDIGMLIKTYEKLFKRSKSQFRQDIFVLLELNFKKDGFFVEFGATNGIDLSNTFLMETKLGYLLILVSFTFVIGLLIKYVLSYYGYNMSMIAFLCGSLGMGFITVLTDKKYKDNKWW